MTMTRTAFYLTDKQLEALKKMDGNVSEHIRRAIDKYIEATCRPSYSPSDKYWKKTIYKNNSRLRNKII